MCRLRANLICFAFLVILGGLFTIGSARNNSNDCVVLQTRYNDNGVFSQIIAIPGHSSQKQQSPYDCAQFVLQEQDSLYLYYNITPDPDAEGMDFPWLLEPPGGGVNTVIYNGMIWTYVIVRGIDHNYDTDGDGDYDITSVDFDETLFVASSEDTLVIIEDHQTGFYWEPYATLFYLARFPWRVSFISDDGDTLHVSEDDSLRFVYRMKDNIQPPDCPEQYSDSLQTHSPFFSVKWKPVVTVHGVTGDSSSFGNLKPILESEGYLVKHFQYDSEVFIDTNVPLEDLADSLSVFLEEHEGELHASERGLNLICHSMGGLISRYYVASYVNHNVDKLVTIGTPHYGAARPAWLGLLPYSGQARQMRFGSAFLWDLHNSWATSSFGTDVLCIAGAATQYGSDHDGTVLLSSANLNNLGCAVHYVPGSHGGDIAYITSLDHPSYMAISTFFSDELPATNTIAVADHLEGCLTLGLHNDSGHAVKVNRLWFGLPDVYWSPRPSFDWPWPGVGYGVNVDDSQGIYYATGVEDIGSSYVVTVFPEYPYSPVTGMVNIQARETTVLDWEVESADIAYSMAVDQGSSESLVFTGTNMEIELSAWPGGNLGVARTLEYPPEDRFPVLNCYWSIHPDIPDSSHYQMEVTINYSDIDLITSQLSEADLSVAYYDNAWHPVSSQTDTVANSISYETNQLRGLISLINIPADPDSVRTISVDLPQLVGDYDATIGNLKTAYFSIEPFDSILSASIELCGYNPECSYMMDHWEVRYSARLDDDDGTSTGWESQLYALYSCREGEFSNNQGAGWEFLEDGLGRVDLTTGIGGQFCNNGHIHAARLIVEITPPVPDFILSLPGAVIGAPGEYTIYSFQILNRGDTADSYDIEVLLENPQYPCSYPAQTGVVEPGYMEQIDVSIYTPSNITGTVTHEASIRVCSQSNPSVCRAESTPAVVETALTYSEIEYVEGCVEITWEISGEYATSSMQLYRSEGGADPVRAMGSVFSNGSEYRYRDCNITCAAVYEYHITFGGSDGVEYSLGEAIIPAPEFRLYQNEPNPFNPATIFGFDLAQRHHITLQIYDLRGRLIRAIIDDEIMKAGYNEREWNGCDDSGHLVSAGVYIYRLQTEGNVVSKRMTLIK